MWVDASNLDAANPPGILTNSVTLGAELGPGFLLPDGRVFLFGANGSSAYYNPKTDLWSKGPNLPMTTINGFPEQLLIGGIRF